MTRIGKFAIGCALLLPLIAFFVSAQSPSQVEVLATVDRNQMSEGDTFTLTISVSSSESFNVSEPRLPNLENFDLINHWKGSESQSTFINGKFQVHRKQTFNFMLAPKKTGTLRIAEAEVNVNGEVKRTLPIDIKVLAGTPGGAPNVAQNEDESEPLSPEDQMDQIFSQLLQRRLQPGFKTQPTNPKESFFIQVQVDKTKAYAGEQVTASFYIYTPGQIRDIDTLKYPNLKGFWKEDIDIATRLDFTNEVINGLVYKKALLASYALFPIKPGKAVVDSYKAKCTVFSLSSYGFGRPAVYTKASKPVAIEVLPLPEAGKPNDFSGAVGNFQVTATLDNLTVPVNQPVSLKVRFEGRGNAKLIDLPALHLPSSVEMYDTKSDAKFFANGTSYKEFEVLLIPREPGEFKIPSMSVSAFDPNSNQYYSRSTPELSLKVLPGHGNEVIPSSPLGLKQDSMKEPQQGPPQIIAAWEDEGSFPLNIGYVWTGLYLAAFAFLLWRARQELGWGRRTQDLGKVLNQRIQNIDRLADQGLWRQVGVELTNLVYFLFGEISAKAGAGLEMDKLLLKAPPSVRRELGEALTQKMKVVEALGFAPEELVGSLKEKSQLRKLTAEMRTLLSKALELGLADASGNENEKSGSAMRHG